MTPPDHSPRLPTATLSFDEVVNDICAALLEHELRVQSSLRGAARVTQFEIDQLVRKIARCEGWLRILGKRTALASVKARVAKLQTGEAPVRSPRLPLDIDVDSRLRRAASTKETPFAAPSP